jgi:hypothetical protein
VFKVSLAVPVLVIVTVNGALVMPITWLPKFKLAGEKLTAGDCALVETLPSATRPKARHKATDMLSRRHA